MNRKEPVNTYKINTIGWWGAYPSAGEATSGYLLQSDDLNILVDCGSALLS
jgi:ribonuclease BN (tRNA processing enzyme)